MALIHDEGRPRMAPRRAVDPVARAYVSIQVPRFRSIGFMPAATDFMPLLTIAWARTVAVVETSPASSLVRLGAYTT